MAKVRSPGIKVLHGLGKKEGERMSHVPHPAGGPLWINPDRHVVAQPFPLVPRPSSPSFFPIPCRSDNPFTGRWPGSAKERAANAMHTDETSAVSGGNVIGRSSLMRSKS